MQNSSYSALFGALTQERRLDIIANNLANVNTAGFKGDRLAFQDTFTRYAHDLQNPNYSVRDQVAWPRSYVLAQPRIAERVIDLTQGPLETTGNPLDLAVAGEGFFRLQTPQGEMLSRGGGFQLSPDGFVVDAQGNRLLGEGGPIQIPQGARDIVITGDGLLSADNEAVDRIPLVRVEDPKALEKMGANLLRIRPESGAAPLPAEDAEVVQGAVEKPNVEVVTEMVNMIETMRAYEAYQKIITGTFEQDKKLITEVGSVR
ncbi:flagellar basal-body rod protein FlgF [Thermodesulfomicrobium sp. WS]|jgi:flagellar basal-body rod protein FlgG|uniref:flagellar basal-body rod protein FlgF n=1 Tax=Thermodesulfomicrobium sp. WS TaxID=3004129 RepID=UPI002491B7F1|nr:flagellar basal-body rod protein FlgF [Thermodesulfomicrobium sp. WS]BDV01765.1 flagellar basal-body rod protein FlgF [Thermodesulfomicrobium sp. WS]